MASDILISQNQLEDIYLSSVDYNTTKFLPVVIIFRGLKNQ